MFTVGSSLHHIDWRSVGAVQRNLPPGEVTCYLEWPCATWSRSYGRTKKSNGIYLRQNYGMEHELGVGIGARLWKASFVLAVNSWAHMTLTFSQSTGLKVFVDCQMVASDLAGTQRFYVEVSFNQFANIFVGQANHLPLEQTSPGVAVWKLTHADAIYSTADCAALTGRQRHNADRTHFKLIAGVLYLI